MTIPNQLKAGGSRPAGRSTLIPEKPLSGTTAILQVLLLLGLPIGLLFLAKLALRAFFPQLGY